MESVLFIIQICQNIIKTYYNVKHTKMRLKFSSIKNKTSSLKMLEFKYQIVLKTFKNTLQDNLDFPGPLIARSHLGEEECPPVGLKKLQMTGLDK